MDLGSEFKDQIIGIIGVIAIFAFAVHFYNKKNVILQIKKDLHDPYIILFMIITMGVIYWGLTEHDTNLRMSVHHAFVALVASYFSHLDMIFPAFYIVLVVEYFSKKYFTAERAEEDV